MFFVSFRILQHDIRRKSPKRMCYHRFLLTNSFCIQHYGCMLLAQIIQMSKGSGFSSDVILCLFRIVSYWFWYFHTILIWFVCISYSISYLYVILSYFISYMFRMCFVLFRILQHDIRRISPKRRCYYRFLLTNTFCIQQYGCVLLA